MSTGFILTYTKEQIKRIDQFIESGSRYNTFRSIVRRVVSTLCLIRDKKVNT